MDVVEMFGEPDGIDILAKSNNGGAVMVPVTNGFIDGSAETQTALLDKMENYFLYTQSGEFRSTFRNSPVILRVTFTEQPDKIISEQLKRCVPWAEDYGVTLEIQINGVRMRLS